MTVWVQIPGDPPFNTGVLKQAIRLNTQPWGARNKSCVYALVAQLAEALGLGPRGWGFESLAAHQYIIAIIYQVITPLVKYRVSGGPE